MENSKNKHFRTKAQLKEGYTILQQEIKPFDHEWMEEIDQKYIFIYNKSCIWCALLSMTMLNGCVVKLGNTSSLNMYEYTYKLDIDIVLIDSFWFKAIDLRLYAQ